MANISDLIHGTKPEVAEFIPTDPLEMLRKLLMGEIKDFPQIQALGDLYQNYMVGGIEKLVPNFSEILGLGGADTESLLREAKPLIEGEVPEDVSKQVFRTDAFTNLMSGGGGQFLHSLQARDIGRTSLDLMKQGAGMLEAGGNAAQRWAGLASGTMMNPGSQLYSPDWYSEFIAKQNASKQATQQFKFNVAAAPDPAWKDRAELLAQYGGVALGGGIGGGGGGAGTAMGSNWSGNMGQGMGYGAGFNYSTPPPAALPAGTGDYKGVIPPQASYFNQNPWLYGGGV